MTPQAELLKSAREKAGFDTAGEFAAMVGIPATTYRSYENGQRPITPRAAQLIAPKLGFAWRDLVSGSPDDDGPVMVTVIGSIAAGPWSAADEWDHDRRYDVPIPKGRDLPGVRHFALKVLGDSMDERYQQDELVIVASLGDLGRLPLPGEDVIVLRRVEQTNDFEATIKQYQPGERGGHRLLPRSSNPEHDEIELEATHPLIAPTDQRMPALVPSWSTSAGTMDVMIVGLVIGKLGKDGITYTARPIITAPSDGRRPSPLLDKILSQHGAPKSIEIEPLQDPFARALEHGVPRDIVSRLSAILIVLEEGPDGYFVAAKMTRQLTEEIAKRLPGQ